MEPDEHEAAREAILDQDNDDDLEYYITFPSPAQVAKKEQDLSPVEAGVPTDPLAIKKLTYCPRDEPEPVVYLLGWAGAEDKNLAKYSRIYEDAGCITIRYTAPAEYVFFNPEKIRPLARRLLDLVEEMSLEGNPVFFHVFSNNGATVYQHMSALLREAKPADDPDDFSHATIVPAVRGMVFDSSPGRRTASSFVRAVSAVLGASPRFKTAHAYLTFFLPYLLLAYVTVLGLIRFVVGLVTTGSADAQGAERAVFDYVKADDGFGVPQLFVYSKTDDVISADDVSEAAEAREKAGCDVTRVVYDESPHVQHLRYHRESYVSSVVSFVGKCLKDGVAKTSTNGTGTAKKDVLASES